MAKEKNTNSRINKTIKKELKKTSKKFSLSGVMAIILCFAVGIAGGIFAEKTLTKNDKFLLDGDKAFNIEIGTGNFVYIEEGYKCISFGKDLSSKVKIETNITKDENGNYVIDTTEEGEYYIIYTVESIKFNKIKRVRTFVVGEINE